MEHSMMSKKSKFSLDIADNLSIMSYLNKDESTSRTSFSMAPSSNQQTDRDMFFHKTIEILLKSGEQRNPKDLRILMRSTENFPYFQRLKDKPSTSVLHSRFCRVMKLRQLRKGETLFYVGDFADRFYIILKGKIVIYVPKQSFDIGEERVKSFYEAEVMDKCLISMKKLASEIKINENPQVSTPLCVSILPRKSTLLDFSRRPTKNYGTHNSFMVNSVKKDKSAPSYSGLDPTYKYLLKKTIYENVKLEDLDEPWNYFTDGVFRYEVGNVLRDGDYFGELGLLTKKPRKATVLCTEDCYLIYLDKNDYKNVVESVDLEKMGRKLRFFENNFLKGFTQDSILKLSYFFTKKKFNLNQIIFQEGEEVDGCYLIKKGEITLHKKIFISLTNNEKDKINAFNSKNLSFSNKGDFREQEFINVCSLGTGSFLGEEDILTSKNTRQLTAISKNNNSVLFFIDLNLFKRVLNDKQNLLTSFLNTAAKKNNWYKKQIDSIENQKTQMIKQRLEGLLIRKDLIENQHHKSISLHLPANIRTSAEDLIDCQEYENSNILYNKTNNNETIRGNSSSSERNRNMSSITDSKSHKIAKLIQNNHAFENFLSKNKFKFEVISSYFSMKGNKAAQKQEEKRIFRPAISNFVDNDNRNSSLNNGDSKNNFSNTLERVMSATFYGLRNKKTIKSSSTSQHFYQTKEKLSSRKISSEENKNSFEKGTFTTYPMEGGKKKITVNNFYKEKFQMFLSNYHQANSYIRKTKHRQFFIVQKDYKRASSAPSIRKF